MNKDIRSYTALAAPLMMAASLLLVFQPASAAEKQIRINNFNTANVTGV